MLYGASIHAGSEGRFFLLLYAVYSEQCIDLWNSPADAIGSVANYFRAFGWRSGLPTHYAVQLQP